MRIRFQFHNGTIKTPDGAVRSYLLSSFNSITVQLRRKITFGLVVRVESFNSITVQLRPFQNPYRLLPA